MMTSYLGIETLRKPIFEYNMPNLFHLVWLTLRSQGLQIKDFFHICHTKYVMATFGPLLKSDPPKRLSKSENETFASDVPRKTCSSVFPSFVMRSGPFLAPALVILVETSAPPTPDACIPKHTTAEKKAGAARTPDRKIAR